MTIPNTSMWRRLRRTVAGRIAVTGLLAASALTGVVSLAVFTDSEDVTSNSFNTDVIDISVSPATALVTATDMLPGDIADGELTITNNGASDVRYAMSTAADNTDTLGLRDQLVATIRTEGTSCAAFDGTQLYSGALSSAAIGNAAQGADAGDRTIAGAGSEILCFEVELPLSTGNAFQDAATTAVFTFDAEQIANNP